MQGKLLYHGDRMKNGFGFDLVGIGERVFYSPWSAGGNPQPVEIGERQAKTLLIELASKPETAWRIRPGNVEDVLGSVFADWLAAQARKWYSDGSEERPHLDSQNDLGKT